MVRVKRGFGLLRPISSTDEKDLSLKEYYQSWRKHNREGKMPFITIYNEFKEKSLLKDLEGGPLKLYLFFTFAANNDYGHSWHSIQNIANYFGTQTRTIDNWLKPLVEKDLIYREQKGKKSHTTFLIPYSNTLIKHSPTSKREKDDQVVLDGILTKIIKRRALYGEVKKVFHTFQWKNTKGKPDNSNNTQVIFIITKRSNGILIGHICSLKKSKHLGVNELNIEDNSVFKSPFKYEGENVTGIILSHEIQLTRRSSTPAILELLEHLDLIEGWQLEERPELQYGPIEEFFIEEENKNESGDDTEIAEE